MSACYLRSILLDGASHGMNLDHVQNFSWFWHNLSLMCYTWHRYSSGGSKGLNTLTFKIYFSKLEYWFAWNIHIYIYQYDRITWQDHELIQNWHLVGKVEGVLVMTLPYPAPPSGFSYGIGRSGIAQSNCFKCILRDGEERILVHLTLLCHRRQLKWVGWKSPFLPSKSRNRRKGQMRISNS